MKKFVLFMLATCLVACIGVSAKIIEVPEAISGVMLLGGSSTATTVGCSTATDSSLESLLSGTHASDEQVTDAIWKAQSFQNGAAFTVTELKLYIKETNEAADTDALIRIEIDDAGVPSGTLVNANATITVDDASITDTYAWVTFTFPATFSLSSSTTYWIVAKNAGTDGAFGFHWDLQQPAYANGQAAQYPAGGPWAAIAYDYLFDLYGCEP